MPSSYGEIRYDRPDMLTDAYLVAASLNTGSPTSCFYAAHGTLHQLIAIPAASFSAWSMIGHRPPEGIGDPANDSHVLWVRQAPHGRGNEHVAAWLGKGLVHVPPYVAEKFGFNNPVDPHGLACFLELVECGRRGGELELEASKERIHQWTEHLMGQTRGIVARELPAFMQDNPTDPNERTT